MSGYDGHVIQESRVILTSEASIDTVQVTFQCVRIGPKQMTLAVFQQVPFEALQRGYHLQRDGTYALNLPPQYRLWGTINYFWPGCDEEAGTTLHEPGDPHIHVLYEVDGRFWRDCLVTQPVALAHLYRRSPRPRYDPANYGGLRAEPGDNGTFYYNLYVAWLAQEIAPLPQLFLAV